MCVADPTNQRRGPDGQFLKAGALSAVVVVTETRQQRRHLARQAAKKLDVAQVASQIWDEVTEGAGVVLVDGKPVKTATEARSDKGESEALK